jgi:hypothetical protein
VQRSFGGNMFSDKRAKQLAQQLAARAFTDYVHGGYESQPVDASTTVIDVGIRMTQDAMEYIDSIGANFDQMIELCEREVETIFNNSLEHFGKRVSFRFFWSSVPVEFSSTTSEPHQHNLEASDKTETMLLDRITEQPAMILPSHLCTMATTLSANSMIAVGV